jgi:hypothetical protein
MRWFSAWSRLQFLSFTTPYPRKQGMSPVPWTGRDTMGGIHSRCATSRRIYVSGRPPSYRTRDSWVKKGGCPHFFPKEGRASCALLPRRTEKAHLERIDTCPNFTLIVCTSAGRGAFARGEGAGRLHDVSGCPAPRSLGTGLHRYLSLFPAAAKSRSRTHGTG